MSDEVKGNEVMFEQRIKNDVAKAITSVAACIVESDAAFLQRARDVAQKLGPERISTLPQFFHNPPKKPITLIGRSENDQALAGEQYYKRGANDLIAFYQPYLQS
jgi:hypothetical protein